MRKYIFILMGGALGAVGRQVIMNIDIRSYCEKIPFNILLINILGCFILSLFLTITCEVMEVDGDIRLGISTGFLGAFTTFSTFCKETINLITAGKCFLAIFYIVLSITLSLGASYLGIILARRFMVKFLRRLQNGMTEMIDERET